MQINNIYQSNLPNFKSKFFINDKSLLKNTKPIYKYKKLYKHKQGDVYTQKRTFDELYDEFSNSLEKIPFITILPIP